jgi:3'-phosphoadenosine 5'-phosphosulfate sulfotransferase (PAPS reductase)/FAD synthetase
MTATPSIATDASVEAAIAAGAWFVFNLSGGKDSGALAWAANAYLDAKGHPRTRRMAIHADLGRAEWKSTPETVERTAAHLGLPLDVVRRSAGDMVTRWEQRFANGCTRYQELSTYNLIGPWSSASLRFCTAELKAQVIGPHLARLLRGCEIVQVLGIRREEGAKGGKRKNAPVSAPEGRYAKPGNKAGTSMLVWNPGVEWLEPEVFACHTAHAIPLHEAYTDYGSSRLSCAFCILASIRDLRAAASAAGNVDLFRHLVALEARSTFSFQPDRWLGDVAPSLLSPGLAADLERAKVDGAERVAIEAAMPAELRYVKGWPPRMPTPAEADAIAAARAPVLARHGLDNLFPTGAAVTDRFAQLMAAQERKAA